MQKTIKKDNVCLDVKNLRVGFNLPKKQKIEIVRGVDIKIYDNQIVGIVGESGSGKSVTTKSWLNLNGNSYTKSDSMTIDGINLSNLKKREWRNIRGKKIAYIPQDPMTSLNPTRTIKKQLIDTLIENRPDLKTDEKRIKYIVEILETFGIRNPESKLNMFPHSFSGGMKQRIVIASAVMSRPSLIIADEPTTALDTVVQAAVLNLFTTIKKKFGVSIAFISHDISVIAKLCDYIYVMYAGKVVECGLKKEIFTDPQHPYTWALLSAIPESNQSGRLYAIPGTPPNMLHLPPGDPFAPRNEFALEIDFVKEPPLIQISPSHAAATWLLHPDAEKVKLPTDTQLKVKEFRKVFK